MDETSLAALARLHVTCMPESLVTRLGERFTRAFYRYVAQSPQEVLAVERDAGGGIVGAAVLSLAPVTLTRRLMSHTPMLLHALVRVPAMLALGVGAVGGARGRPRPDNAVVHRNLPQLILIFTHPSERGRGHGTSLLMTIESRLRMVGVACYEVRTVAAPSNPALAFYAGRGFEPAGITSRYGTPFQVFLRTLSPERSAG